MNQNDTDETALIAQHEADHDHHRFQGIIYRGNHWDLSHLDPFAFFVEIEKDRRVLVMVLFSCHCFTHNPKHDKRPEIPIDELFSTKQESRVLNEERYNLSKTLLTQIVRQLHLRHITVADAGRNFVTVEQLDHSGNMIHYGVFFEVEKRKHRGGHILLRVQSARKVRFAVLIKAIYEGRKIRP